MEKLLKINSGAHPQPTPTGGGDHHPNLHPQDGGEPTHWWGGGRQTRGPIGLGGEGGQNPGTYIYIYIYMYIYYVFTTTYI